MTPSSSGARRCTTALAVSVSLGFALALGGTALAQSAPGEINGSSAFSANDLIVAQSSATPAPGEATQPSPPQSSGPAVNAPGTGKGTPRSGNRPSRKFEHLDIAPTIQYTISSGSDVIPMSGPPPNALPYDLVRLTGEARWRFNSHLGVQYQRIAHTGAAGRQYKNGKPSYGGSGYDYEERELATWTFNPYLVYRAGYHYRSRVCCPGPANTATPRFLGGFFTDLTYRWGPDTIGGKPWTTNFRWEQNYHRFNAAAQSALAHGDYDSGQKPTFSFTQYENFYFWHQNKVVPYYGIEYFSTYFSNNPHMSETYRKVYGVAYRATRDITWRAYVKNDQPGGVAASAGDASHKSTAFLEATYDFHR